jgi:hypothetical protein
MTSAASNPQLSNFGFELFGLEVDVRLGLDVMTEDAVRIPLRRMLKIVITVGIKEGSVQAHPAPVYQIVGERQSRVLTLLFSQVLFDAP